MTYVPIGIAREAFIAGEIGVAALEACFDAAYAQREIAIPPSVQARAYRYLQGQVRFSDVGPAPLESVFFLL